MSDVAGYDPDIDPVNQFMRGTAPNKEFYDRVIEERQEAMAVERGFRIADHSLIIHVDCERRDCPHRGE